MQGELCFLDESCSGLSVAAWLRDCRSRLGTQMVVEILEHHSCDDTIIICRLPQESPEALVREWVEEWWSEGDETLFGPKDHYIAGFFESIQEGDKNGNA